MNYKRSRCWVEGRGLIKTDRLGIHIPLLLVSYLNTFKWNNRFSGK